MLFKFKVDAVKNNMRLIVMTTGTVRAQASCLRLQYLTLRQKKAYKLNFKAEYVTHTKSEVTEKTPFRSYLEINPLYYIYS